jgi:hypothetical protein
MTEYPGVVDDLVAAINSGDTEALMALLAPQAVVNDWGSIYSTPDEIRTWNARELIGAKGQLTISNVTVHGQSVAFHAEWRSSFFTGPSKFVLALSDGRIRQWRITAP